MSIDCACVYVENYDCGYWELFSKQIRKARKVHKCAECRRDILPGEKYEYTRGRWSEDCYFYSHKTCSDCLSIREIFFCDGFIYGEMFYDLQQYFADLGDDIPWSWLAQVTPAARAQLCKMVEKMWLDYE